MFSLEDNEVDFASGSDDPDKVQLLYPSSSVTAARGSSFLLSCEALYDPLHCHHVHVAWFQGSTKAELTRPYKYLTTVSESFIGERRRRRQVATEILDLQLEDAGGFQCVALCAGEISAMGHFIRITFAGD